jgi:thymidylate synthase (FAD)
MTEIPMTNAGVAVIHEPTHTNSVELIGHYGGDESHALSAWTSTSRDLSEDKRSRMDAMLLGLAQNGHHTPFEKSYLHFLICCDTASHIHLIKHRVGVSVNAESARYKELKEDKYYLPSDWPADLASDLAGHVRSCYAAYHRYIVELESRGVSRKRAKESARFILPYANQTIIDVGFNFRSFMHFQKLRNSVHAQVEIKELAQDMLQLVRGIGQFDLSLKAFGYA